MGSRYPFPAYPNGWFAVLRADELGVGEVVGRRFFGQDVVLFRTQSGRAVMLDAYCPHMGAHLAEGGVVEGESIQCPFHLFCFDGEGACVSTPYGGKVPPKAKTRSWPLVERNGFLLTWHHLGGEPPSWEVPEVPFAGWTGLKSTTFTIRTHCQEATENSVDLGHFSSVHGYRGVDIVKPLNLEGPLLTIAYKAARATDNIGLPGQVIDFIYDIQAWGLGYSFVKVDVNSFGVTSRQYILATPIDEEHIQLLIATHMTELPSAQATEQVADLIFKGYANDVAQDVPIWENKIYVDPPILAQGDGPIGPYRQWARRFYQA